MSNRRLENKIWLAKPVMHGEEMKYVQEAYDTNWMTTLGANIDAIESEIAGLLGTSYAVALASGTSALHLTVRLAAQSLYNTSPTEPALSGHKVFCSDMTFSATVNPISYEGGEQVFIDSEYDTWNMDPEALRLAFEKYPDVRIVVLAHLYGTPARITEIKAICDEHKAVLIEDAAESLGASVDGKQTGSFGEFGIISFNGNKIITGSSGGMLLTNDENAANKIRKWSTQARDKAPWYQHSEMGYNYRMSNVIAGVVRGQLPYLQEHINRKKNLFERYSTGLADLPIQMNPHMDNTVPNYWLSCMTINEESKVKPAEILQALVDINAEGRPIWKPMHLQPIYENLDFITAHKKPVDEDIFERGLCLPSDITMTEAEQDIIIETIRECFNK